VASALRTVGLRRCFGAFAAVDGVSLEIDSGARHALIGPNGAGKTTLIDLLTGVLRPDAGEVALGTETITRLPPHRRVARGLARTFQISSLFPGLTVLESVMLAICQRAGAGATWWQPLASRRAALEQARELLSSLQLESEAGRLGRELAHGKQRLLEIALALATGPRVLLLDEPAAGIPVAESRALFETIERLPAGMTILFIEHDMSLVFRFAQRISVMVDGRILVEGTPAEIAADERVRRVYLGEKGQPEPGG
jgi:branched-chain amino acid transport system ATP-binding protein